MVSVMTDKVHGEHDLKKIISSLSPDERRELQRILYSMNEEDMESSDPVVSISDLRGLGKELWEDIDADDHVKRERDSWDG